MTQPTLLDMPTMRRSPRRVGSTYFIRTFGCQMNDHDSERIAGLLDTDGMTRADRAEDADLVEQAVRNVLESCLRTGDIMQPGMTEVRCTQMGEAVTDELGKLAG